MFRVIFNYICLSSNKNYTTVLIIVVNNTFNFCNLVIINVFNHKESHCIVKSKRIIKPKVFLVCLFHLTSSYWKKHFAFLPAIPCIPIRITFNLAIYLKKPFKYHATKGTHKIWKTFQTLLVAEHKALSGVIFTTKISWINCSCGV